MKRNRWIGMMVAVVALIGFACAHAGAADTKSPIVIKVGGSELKNAKDYWATIQEPRLKRISAIDDKIVDVQIVSPQTFYVLGKDFGSTSLMIWEKDLEDPIKIDVIVLLDLTTLKQKLYELYPSQPIEVYASETGVVLSGTVSGPEVVEEVLRLTQNFLPKKAAGKIKGGTDEVSGSSSAGVTNLLKVGAIQQVLLEVKFAEVDRSSSRDWQAALGLVGQNNDFIIGGGVNPLSAKYTKGFNADGSPQFDIGDLGQNGGQIPNWGGTAGDMLLNFAGNAANIFVNYKDITASLKLLETEGLARVLAEPRLVTMSGQEASFLAGGEFPVPVAEDDGQVSIEYKEFGVGLRFTPIVMSDGKISLRVAPSVSDIASSSIIPAGIAGANFIVPNLNSRKLETTVQLHDGQTIALAGLLQDTLREEVSKIPGLGDLPILGALFRSSGYIQQKTDLLIAVTPHLVKPVKEGELIFPGEHMRPPNALEFYLLGKLENYWTHDDPSLLSGHEFTPVPATVSEEGGMEGQFGQVLPK